jgi:hypothetical protein
MVAGGGISGVCVLSNGLAGEVFAVAGMGEALDKSGFAEQAAKPIHKMRAKVDLKKRIRVRNERQNLTSLGGLSGFLV